VLAQTSTSIEDAALFAEMLSLANDGRYPALELDPQQRRQRTLRALVSQMEALSRKNSVLIIFEDAHWSDPTSLEAFGRVVDRIAKLPVLLIETFRPEFEPPWIGRPYVTFMALNRLGESDVSAIIDGVVGNKPLPASFRQDIIERTDGIPLFVEEMTKAVLEAESDNTAERTAESIPSSVLAVPASLHASLMARIDRLGPAKEVAQVGAAIGREFSHPLLAAVLRQSESELGSVLDRLIAAGLLFRQGLPPHSTYLFKHVLVQDAAYSALLRSRRLELHARIATILETQFPETAELQPELLAGHYTNAGLIEQAVAYWIKAGQQAISRWAMNEAAAQLCKGLDLIPAMTNESVRDQHELGLQIALGHALIATKGHGAHEPGRAYARARLLCDKLHRTDQLLLILRGQCSYHLVRAELDQADRYAEEMWNLGIARNDSIGKCFAWRFRGTVRCYLGKFSDARVANENALSLWDPQYRTLAPSPEDGNLATSLHLSRTLLYLGYIDQARSQRDEAMADARRLSPYNLAFALLFDWFGIDWAIRGIKSAQAMLGTADELLVISGEHNFRLLGAYGNIMRGWCLCALEEKKHDIDLIFKGLDVVLATGCNLLVPFILMVAAESYWLCGQPEKGIERLDEAVRLLESTNERWLEAEIHRVRGQLLTSVQMYAAGEDSYRIALAAAQRQSAKFWELRAAMSMARLWRDQGKRQQAYDLLAPVYGWFTEGFDTLDLKQARTLLIELRR
jgi:tetratricopeptide (TPR) repeat protein